jgi:uracil-DNA glycosylase family 4
MNGIGSFSKLEEEIIDCRQCTRLVTWREEISRKKRKAFSSWNYWGKPVPGFGDWDARVMVVGLAPGAHGSNRTGRMFTGDASGDFLYPALFLAGFSNRSKVEKPGDGLELTDLFITAVCRCVPPDNKPTNEEMNTCLPFFKREVDLIQPRVFVALGRIAFERILLFHGLRRSLWKFEHGAVYSLDGEHSLVCSYHPSRQNTQTGRLTREMFSNIWLKVQAMHEE